MSLAQRYAALTVITVGDKPQATTLIGKTATERKLDALEKGGMEVALAHVATKGKVGAAARGMLAARSLDQLSYALSRGNVKPLALYLATLTGESVSYAAGLNAAEAVDAMRSRLDADAQDLVRKGKHVNKANKDTPKALALDAALGAVDAVKAKAAEMTAARIAQREASEAIPAPEGA